MEIKANLSGKNEYNAVVENVSVRLLVNEGYNALPYTDLLISHTHLYTELFVCSFGELHIQTNSGLIRLFKGDAAIIPANMPHHKTKAQETEGWYAVGFFITKKSKHSYSDLYKKLLPIYEIKEPLIFRNVPEIAQRVASLHNPSYKDGDCLPAIEIVCILSLLAAAEPKPNYSDTEAQTRMPDIYRMAWFEDLIANRYYEPLTTSKVADMLHISARHLSRIIKEQYGITFHEFLVKTRLNNAAKLLTATDRSVNSIIKKVGYSKSSSFYKDFSARFGMTPTEYRENFTQKK